MNAKMSMSTLRGISVMDSIDIAVRSGYDGIEIQYYFYSIQGILLHQQYPSKAFRS